MANGSFTRDDNRVPYSGGADSSTGAATNETIDHTTGGIWVDIVGGSSAGQQYTDGAASPTHPIGPTIIFNAAGTMTAVSEANPLPINNWGLAATALPTPVTGGSIVQSMMDKDGRTVTTSDAPRALKGNIPQLILSSTSETTLVGQIGSTYIDITAILVANSSATAVRVDFRDSTGGTIQFSMYIPAGNTVGFSGQNYKQTTVNTNWTAQASANVSSLYISGNYIQNN